MRDVVIDYWSLRHFILRNKSLSWNSFLWIWKVNAKWVPKSSFTTTVTEIPQERKLLANQTKQQWNSNMSLRGSDYSIVPISWANPQLQQFFPMAKSQNDGTCVCVSACLYIFLCLGVQKNSLSLSLRSPQKTRRHPIHSVASRPCHASRWFCNPRRQTRQ